MENKCRSYKFFLLMVLSVASSLLCIGFLSQIPYLLSNVPYIMFSLLAFGIVLAYTICLLCSEPIAYIIKEGEIQVKCVLRRYCFQYREIERIVLRYDPEFKFFLIKDYDLSLDIQGKVPERCRRIMKTRKTKKLIEKYFGEKIREF